MSRLVFRLVEDAEVLDYHSKKMRGITLYSVDLRIGDSIVRYVPSNHVYKHEKGLLISEKTLMGIDYELPGVPLDKFGNVVPEYTVQREFDFQVSLLKVEYGAPFDATSDTVFQRRTGRGWNNHNMDTMIELSVSYNSVLAREDGAVPASEAEKLLRLPQGFVATFFTSDEKHHINKSGKMSIHYCTYKIREKLPEIKSLILKYKGLLAKMKKDIKSIKQAQKSN